MIKSSTYWKTHFENNLQQQRIDWAVEPTITQEQKNVLLYSIRAWQLGETGEGTYLLAAAKRSSQNEWDADYMSALRLFIKEEQKHGRNLGLYLAAIGEPRAERDWGAWFFRSIRHFNTSLEVWTIAVIIAEYAAQIFYQSLHDATECTLLQAICKDILIDEAHHIKFQNERLHVIFRDKTPYGRVFTVTWACLLFFGTIHAIWFGHAKAFKAGGVNRGEFMRGMYHRFFKTISFIHGRERVATQPAMRVV